MVQPETPDWVRDAVFYQIFPDRFARSLSVAKPRHLDEWGATPTYHGYQGGDLIGVTEHLDYLQDLGASAIYFTPVFQSASNHRYHTHDYEKVDPMLGGNEALKRLIDQAHARGIRIVLDGVFNHASRGFFQFHDIMENGPNSAYLDWFHVSGFPLNAYDTEKQPNYGAWWGLPALPKFNTGCPDVRAFLWGIGRKWIDFGIDGWRLDVANEINDDSFWREFRHRVKSGNPDAYIVGEVWTDAPHWLQGDMWDAVMNYHFTRACIAFFVAEDVDQDELRRTSLHPVGAPGAQAFRKAIERLYRTLRTLGHVGHAEPARQPRHGPVLDPGTWRPVCPSPGDRVSDDIPRRSVHLLWRRDRHARRPRPGEPRRVSLAQGRDLGHRAAARISAFDLAPPRPALIAPGYVSGLACRRRPLRPRPAA